MVRNEREIRDELIEGVFHLIEFLFGDRDGSVGEDGFVALCRQADEFGVISPLENIGGDCLGGLELEGIKGEEEFGEAEALGIGASTTDAAQEGRLHEGSRDGVRCPL